MLQASPLWVISGLPDQVGGPPETVTERAQTNAVSGVQTVLSFGVP